MGEKYDYSPCYKDKTHLHLFVILSYFRSFYTPTREFKDKKNSGLMQINIVVISVVVQNVNSVTHIVTVIDLSAKREKYLLLLRWSVLRH